MKSILIKIAALVLVLGLGSCANKITPQPLKPIASVKVPIKPNPGPVLVDAQQVSGEADQQAAIAAERLAKAQAGASAAQKKAIAAQAEANRLRDQKTATEAELKHQSELVTDLTDSVAGLESDLESVSQSLTAEKALRKKVSESLIVAERMAVEKQQEAENLRTQLTHAEASVLAYYEEAKANADAAAKAEQDNASASGAKKTWRGIAFAGWGLATVLTLIFIVFPLARKTLIGT